MKKLNLEEVKAYNNLIGVENNKTNIKNTKFVLNEFLKYQNSKDSRKYIKKEVILNNDLESLKDNYECMYIENTDIHISVRKRPIKKGKYEYSAVGYDFIQFLKANNLSTETIR